MSNPAPRAILARGRRLNPVQQMLNWMSNDKKFPAVGLLEYNRGLGRYILYRGKKFDTKGWKELE